jgi:hypothetical protein
MKVMESGTLRRMVWDEMLFASMRSNYFGELVLHYQNLEKWLTVCSALASSGAVATAVTAASQWVKIGFPAVAAANGFWLLFSQYSIQARDAADLHAGWNSLSTEYERIWNHLDDPQAEEKFDQAFERAEILSKSGTKFPNNTKRLGYWLVQCAELAIS